MRLGQTAATSIHVYFDGVESAWPHYTPPMKLKIKAEYANPETNAYVL